MVLLEQAHLDTGTSLDKHLALGAWFAAISAGYGLSRLVRAVNWRRAAVVTCAAMAVAFPAIGGWTSAFGVYHLWPDAATYIKTMRPLVEHPAGPLLVVQYSSATEYYLGGASNWRRWISVSLNPTYAGAGKLTWPAYYQAQLSASNPALIALPMQVTFTSEAAGDLLLSNLAASLRTGNQGQVRRVLLQIASADVSTQEPGFFALAATVANDSRYRIVSIAPYDSHIATGLFAIWQRIPAPVKPADSEHHRATQ